MRVVSLLPSAAEHLHRLGVEPVGVSHSCGYPLAARDLPTPTDTVIDHGADRSAADTDRVAVRGFSDALDGPKGNALFVHARTLGV